MNIDKYTIEELLNILNFDIGYEPTREEIINQVINFNQNLFYNDKKMQNFFLQIQDKLIRYYNDKNSKFNNNMLPKINSNIETMKNINDNTKNSDTENSNTENSDTENSDTENDDIENSDMYEKKTLSKSKFMERYQIYNYLHFNTIYRAKNNELLETPIPSTNSNFILSNPINNISQIKLASINIKKPYLISESKNNNKFIIKKYVKNPVDICDFSQTIIIEDGYYDTEESLEKYLNDTYFNNSSINDFMKNITFSINKNSKKILFKLSDEYISNTNDASFNYFTIDFKTNYIAPYSLATILGFNYSKLINYYTSINEVSNNRINNNIIKSPYIFSNIGNSELFFCFDEFNSNIIETHKLFLNNNMSSNKILAKINTSLGHSGNNYYINEVFSVTNYRNDIIRKYDGVINLLNFNIKIIDYYGNIVNTNINENFTFTLEVKINNIRITSNK